MEKTTLNSTVKKTNTCKADYLSESGFPVVHTVVQSVDTGHESRTCDIAHVLSSVSTESLVSDGKVCVQNIGSTKSPVQGPGRSMNSLPPKSEMGIDHSSGGELDCSLGTSSMQSLDVQQQLHGLHTGVLFSNEGLGPITGVGLETVRLGVKNKIGRKRKLRDCNKSIHSPMHTRNLGKRVAVDESDDQIKLLKKAKMFDKSSSMLRYRQVGLYRPAGRNETLLLECPGAEV
ncbi:hypothetical protein ACOSP7_028722 [Xanthoceras sorbifolium]